VDLLDKYGCEWFVELEKSEVRLGSGINPYTVHIEEVLSPELLQEYQDFTIQLNEMIRTLEKQTGQSLNEPLDGFMLFLEDIEEIDWKGAHPNDLLYKREILWKWREQRIDYYRSVNNKKLPEARTLADLECESVDIGFLSEACRSCGLIFYDNFQKHYGIRGFYCSIICEEKSTLSCIYCESEYTVGKGTKSLRMMKLEGFCSVDCLNEFKDDEKNDSDYIYRLQRIATKFGAAYDRTITRRKVFENAKGLCAICGKKTHFDRYDEFSPLLASVDHIIPWTKGGNHKWDNVQLCCLRCNIVKGNRI
jgi:hypothetical protein